MAKVELKKNIELMSEKLQETRGSVRRNRGPVDDAVLVVIPMIEDMLGLIQQVVSELPDE